jgi:putative ATPase
MTAAPFYDALRPQTFEDIEGQPHLVGPSGILTQYLKKSAKSSILLYGPSGSGKTSIAKLYAQQVDKNYVSISPLSHGVADLKKIVEGFAASSFFSSSRALFVDEIHRFNKAQQDFFLPYLENGSLILIAATTENPAASLNQALLSRIKTYPVYPLTGSSLEALLEKLLLKCPPLSLSPCVKQEMVEASCGDARYLINLVETALSLDVEKTPFSQWCQKKPAIICNQQVNHSHLISALQKSIRHNNPNAALYYLARLIESAGDLLMVVRRLIRIAVEDIGLADPQALVIANTTWDAYRKIGSPEGDLVLAQFVLYLALAPKSPQLLAAFSKASEKAKISSPCDVPSFLQIQGYTPTYNDYNALEESAFFLKPDLHEEFYAPSLLGFEQELLKRWEYFKKKKTKKNLRLFP